MLWPDLEFLWSIPMDLRGVQSVGTVGQSSTSERAWFQDGFDAQPFDPMVPCFDELDRAAAVLLIVSDTLWGPMAARNRRTP